MKRIAIILFSVLFLFSCGSTGDGGDFAADDDYEYPDYYYEPSAYVFATPTDTGLDFEVTVLDAQGDVNQIEYSIYLNDNIYYGPNVLSVDMQDKTFMDFYFHIDISLPPDEYTIYVKAIDADGFESPSAFDTFDTNEDPPDSTAPWALSPDILKYTAGGDPEYEDTYFLTQGDSYIWEISASDDEMDITQVRVTLYSTAGGYSDPEFIDLPEQTHNPMVYRSDIMTADMPIGEYRYYFTVIDDDGNESDERYTLFWIEK